MNIGEYCSTVAQYCLPQPSRGNSLQSKKKSLSCYQQTNTRFDSFSNALHTKGPKMKAAVSVLAAEGLIALDDVSVSVTEGTIKITQHLWSLMCN